MKIEAEIENLKQILVNDEKFYQIPNYQRPYSWNRDNLSDLIDDLAEAFVSNKDESYFCGSLVLVKNERDKRLDIIDGQQRTTTFTILFCVLRDLYFKELDARTKDYVINSIQDKYDEKNRKLRFLTSEDYQVEFEQTVLKGIDFSLKAPSAKSNNRYLKNAFHIRDYLNEAILKHSIDIREFAQWLYENVVLTVITCPNEDSAIQIFNVLNDRGMPLSPIDILKSRLMQRLDAPEDRNAFKAQWDKINTSLKIQNLDLDSALNIYLYYKTASNPKTRLDKELFEVFSKSHKTSLEIISEIYDIALAYIDVMTSNDKHTHCLKYLKHKIYWQSILCTSKAQKYTYHNELKKMLVAYYYQNWIAGATVARIKQTSLNVIKHIKKNADIDVIRQELKSNTKRYSTTKNFKEELISSYVYGRPWVSSLLLMIEYFSNDSKETTFIPLNNKIQLEHILPQKPSTNWNQFSKDDIETWTDSLANLTLLSMRKNIQAQNFDYQTKKEVYKDKDNVTTSFLITQKLFEFEDWTVESLQTREDMLVKKITSLLKI